jgi:protein-disulfide isomerase
MAKALEKLRQKHPGDIRLLFVNSPVHSDCNPGIKRPVHDEACALGELAEAAAILGRFWEYHDYVFTRIPSAGITAEAAVAHLRDMGIDPEAAHKVLVSGEAKAALERDVALSNRFELINTPSLVLNGYGKRGGVYPEALGPIVEMMLKKAGVE